MGRKRLQDRDSGRSSGFDHAKAKEMVKECQACADADSYVERLYKGLIKEKGDLREKKNRRAITEKEFMKRASQIDQEREALQHPLRIIRQARKLLEEYYQPVSFSGTTYFADITPLDQMMLSPQLAGMGSYLERLNNGMCDGLIPCDHHNPYSRPALWRGIVRRSGDEGLRKAGIFLMYDPHKIKSLHNHSWTFDNWTDDPEVRNMINSWSYMGPEVDRYVSLLTDLSKLAIEFQGCFRKTKKKLAIIRKKRDLEEITDMEFGLHIGKSRDTRIQKNDFYSFWYSDGNSSSPVFQYNGDTSDYMFATASRNYQEIKRIDTREILPEDLLEAMVETFDFKKGDYFTANGRVFRGKDEEEIRGDFAHALRTKFKFPTKKTEAREFFGKFSKERESEPPKLRHWGFEYLRELKPDYIEPGPITGEGVRYIAHFFTKPNVVVLEATHTQHATYFLSASKYERIKGMERAEWRELTPEQGYLGSVDHRKEERGGVTRWKKKVREALEMHTPKKES